MVLRFRPLRRARPDLALACAFACALLGADAATAAVVLPHAPPGAEVAAAGRAPFDASNLADLTGVRILHTTYDNFAGVPSIFLDDLVARGAEVDVLDHTTDPYPLLDGTYDVLVLQALGSVPAGQDLADLLAWVRSGGKSILFEGVTYSLIGAANLLADSLNLGWTCQSIHPGQVLITDLVAHPITAEVHSLQDILEYYTQFVDVHAPAAPLFRRPQGEVVGAYAELESTRMVYIGMSLLWNNRIGLADNRRLANQAIDWLAAIGGAVPVQPSTWTRVKNLYRR
jgi:hypothetical protein